MARRKSWLREKVVADLQAYGPVEDTKGQAIHRLRERVGHHSSMSVGNIVRLLEAEGNLIRVAAKDGAAPRDREGNASPHVRRTYSIRLTDEFIATLPPIEMTPPPVEGVPAEALEPVAVVAEAPAESDSPAESDVQLPDGIDYDLLGNAILGVVFNNMAASKEVEELRDIRGKLAETQAALAEAKEVISALGADLKAERKHRGKIEDEAAALSLEIESLKAELKAATETGLDTAKVRIYPAVEQMNDRSRKAMAQLMQAIPTARG